MLCGCLLCVLLTLALSMGAKRASSLPLCTLYASPTGSDSYQGTYEKPFRTIRQLLQALGGGQTGCLRVGTFEENVTFTSGGSPGAPLTLRSTPGERATIRGRLYVAQTAADVVVSHLLLDGVNMNMHASPIVNGDRVSLLWNEITNEHSGICILLGPGFEDPLERAIDPVVEGNRIHDCGRLPPTGHDHGIYVEGTTNARITNNVIYDNAGYGVHLYPDGDGSFIASNVIDGNGGGLIFAGQAAGGEYEQPHSSDDNVVESNIFSHNSGRNNLESWWGGPTGTGNIVKGNCFWKGDPQDIDESEGGFIHLDDTFADPLYVDRASKNFTLRPGSPCKGKGAVEPPAPLAPTLISPGGPTAASGRAPSPSR
jgi:parallel beta-helix repeat protein